MIKVNKPKIRFNEFENIWTKSKLGELYEIYSGNTPSRSDSRNYQNGEIPWIKTTDLNNSIICSNEEKISVYGATKLKVLPEKSVLIAMYGGFNQIGRTGLLAYPATINQALAALMPVNEINPNFLLNFLNFKKESWRNVAASSRKDPNITKNDVEKFKISFPSLDEQSAIGSLFRTLDDLLASYKDNLANYQSLKATMLSKMFPKAGQTVPEIRLDGFEGEWEKGTIGEFGSFYYGKSAPKWSVTDDATTPCVRYGELYTKFSTKIDKIYSYTSIPKENLKLSSGNEVLVPRVGENPLDFANCSWLSLKGVAIGEMISVYNTPNNPLFIAYYFNAKMKKEFAKRVEGGSVANLYYTYLENISISVPSLPEQQAIGAYFSNLDNLISAHQEKIFQLETLKEKLLQDMFI